MNEIQLTRLLSLIAIIILFALGFIVHPLFKTAADNTSPQKRKRRIYIVHPYGGDPENKALITEICRALTAQGFLVISPVHNFDFLNDENQEEREITVKLRKELILTADEVYVFGDWSNSEDCIREIAAADNAEIIVKNYPEGVI